MFIRYVYIRLHSTVNRQCLLTSVKLRLINCFQFTKKIKNKWNSEKVYLVVCRCFLVVRSRLLVACGRFLVVYGRLCSLSSFTSGLGVICGFLWPFVVVACFSNYAFRRHINHGRKDLFTRQVRKLLSLITFCCSSMSLV